VLLPPRAGPAGACLESLPVAEVGQRGEVRCGEEDDVAAPSPIAAVGSAARDVRLAPEGDHASPAAPALDDGARPVDERHQALTGTGLVNERSAKAGA
jgi:hypothetical protein